MTPTLAIGIDIGGTNTSFGVVSREGQLLEKQKIATTGHADLNAYIAQLAGGIAPMIAQYGQEHFAGVGIGAPSGNIHTGEIIYSPNLPWKGIIPMAQIIGNAL
ncbi:MAG: ROK family protein, partial [Chitinophagia bacterium]|nr:ROK family protein [Chitinophagia bacterium]